MIITCQQCNSKIRAPEAASGKRVKCPKCAAIVPVPKSEEKRPDSVPATPQPPPIEVEPEPEEATGAEVTASKPARAESRSKPVVDDEDDWQPPERYDEHDDD